MKRSTDREITLKDLKEVLQVLILLCDELKETVEGLKVLNSEADRKIRRLEVIFEKTEPLEEILTKEKSVDEKVLRLSEGGLSIEKISKMLGIPEGEVELVLNLYGGKKCK